jgi:hypothetical protein
MTARCSKCEINWAQLHSVMSGEEDYHFCPQCLSDRHLEEVDSMTTYIMCPFTGKIIDIDTKEELKKDIPMIIEVERKPVEKIDYFEREKRELDAILSYQQSGNEDDYFKAFKE